MIRQKIEKCILNCVEVKCDIDANTNLKVYGLDSLVRVQLVIELEEEFNITFNTNDLTQHNFETVNSIYCLLNEYGVR